MKIFILGTGKTGTTALVYKVAGGLPNCKAFSGGKPGKYVGQYENAVYKHTIEERKGKSFDLYRDHLRHEHYDRKIWMARDPRDAAVSRMLYRWHRGIWGQKKQYQAHLDLILKKEQDPGSVAFHEICRYSGHNGWPRSVENVIKEEQNRYVPMCDFVRGLGDDWFLFKYEEMVDQKFDALNDFLGFKVRDEAEVPIGTGKEKVIRKKAYGDWRHWFLDEDVALFKPAFLPYMQVVGYNCDDWNLNPEPVIEPQFSSEYMQSLPRKAKKNTLLRFIDNLSQKLMKKS
jgi:hypothetical protein